MQWNGAFHVEVVGKSIETETRTRLEIWILNFVSVGNNWDKYVTFCKKKC